MIDRLKFAEEGTHALVHSRYVARKPTRGNRNNVVVYDYFSSLFLRLFVSTGGARARPQRGKARTEKEEKVFVHRTFDRLREGETWRDIRKIKRAEKEEREEEEVQGCKLFALSKTASD